MSLIGDYGCMECLDKGIHVNNRHLWLHNPTRQLKTTKWWDNVLHELEVGAVKPPSFGVKDRSMLSFLNIDPFKQNPLDFMHQSYEGTVDKIFYAIFGKQAYLY